jgi:hypothetical protein
MVDFSSLLWWLIDSLFFLKKEEAIIDVKDGL